MWIKRTLFERLLTEKAQAEGQSQALAHRVVAQDAAIQWMQVRLTQLEYERAQLIQNYMGIKLPVLELQTVATDTLPATAEQILNQTISFDDVGDDAAKEMGLGWDREGRLERNGKLVQE